MPYTGPFHKGELDAQALFNTSEEADVLGRRMLQPVIAKNVHPYIKSLSYVAVSFVNMIPIEGIAVNSSWSSILFGQPGFMSVSSDGKTVHIHNAVPSQTILDLFKQNLESGIVIPVALMAISFESRTRYRINGCVRSRPGKLNGNISFDLQVEVAFGNCPKYIQSRSVSDESPQQLNSAQLKLPPIDAKSALPPVVLDAASVSLIQSCDTFFVSTYSHSSCPSTSAVVAASSSSCSLSADISHRGGQPGFIRVLSPSSLVWPEYQGNNMFITLGNIVSNPRVGLLLIDFSNNRLLQLSGDARLVTVDSASDAVVGAGVMDGSHRYVQLTITETVLTSPLQMDFALLERSPYNPPTSGFTGRSTTSPLSAAAQSSSMLLTKVTPLSNSVASFRFNLTPPHKISSSAYFPGQFASVNIALPLAEGGGGLTSFNRSWTVTDIELVQDHSDRSVVHVKSIEFTVKRGQSVSRWLHDSFYGSSDPGKKWTELMTNKGLMFAFAGLGGSFSIYSRSSESDMRRSTLSPSVVTSGGKVLFLSGGIGVTPFISIIKSLSDSFNCDTPLDVILMASFRSSEESRIILPLMKHIQENVNNKKTRVSMLVFVTSAIASDTGLPEDCCNVQYGNRITASQIAEYVKDVRERDVYLCGPDVFMSSLSEGLVSQVGVREEHIHTEDFSF